MDSSQAHTREVPLEVYLFYLSDALPHSKPCAAGTGRAGDLDLRAGLVTVSASSLGTANSLFTTDLAFSCPAVYPAAVTGSKSPVSHITAAALLHRGRGHVSYTTHATNITGSQNASQFSASESV